MSINWHDPIQFHHTPHPPPRTIKNPTYGPGTAWVPCSGWATIWIILYRTAQGGVKNVTAHQVAIFDVMCTNETNGKKTNLWIKLWCKTKPSKVWAGDHNSITTVTVLMLTFDNLITYSDVRLVHKIIHNAAPPLLKNFVRLCSVHIGWSASSGDCIVSKQGSSSAQSALSYKAMKAWKNFPANLKLGADFHFFPPREF